MCNCSNIAFVDEVPHFVDEASTAKCSTDAQHLPQNEARMLKSKIRRELMMT